MKFWSSWIAAAAVSLLSSAAAAQNVFEMSIDNVQEQAAGLCLIGSTAQGTGTATFVPGTSTLSWNITFGNNSPSFDNGLLDQGAEIAAHFHIGPPGVSGGVAVNVGTGNPKAGSAVLTASEVAALQAGNFYINIHSSGCGSGEIRGQVLASQVPAVPLWGILATGAALVFGASRVLRRPRG